MLGRSRPPIDRASKCNHIGSVELPNYLFVVGSQGLSHPLKLVQVEHSMNFEDFCKLPVRTGSSTVTRRFITPLVIENFDIHVCLIFSIKAPMVRFLNNRCEDICSGCRGRLPTGILIERGLVVMALQPSGFLRDGTGGSRCL